MFGQYLDCRVLHAERLFIATNPIFEVSERDSGSSRAEGVETLNCFPGRLDDAELQRRHLLRALRRNTDADQESHWLQSGVFNYTCLAPADALFVTVTPATTSPNKDVARVQGQEIAVGQESPRVPRTTSLIKLDTAHFQERP